MEHNLYFNIIPFHFPTGKVTMYFHKDAELHQNCRLHKSLFPNGIETIMDDITPETEFIACSYGIENEEFTSLDVDFKTENRQLIKRHYTSLISHYFKNINPQLCKVNFINEIDVWVPADFGSNYQFTVYDKFRLSINIGKITITPELLISYEGQTKVFKESVATLMNRISPELYTRVLYQGTIQNYKYLQEVEDRDLTQIFPILNNNIRRELHIVPKVNPFDNKYAKYEKAVSKFYEKYLNNQVFKQFIPLFDEGFLKVPQHRISRTRSNSNDLAFGKIDATKRGKHTVTHLGLTEFGPYSSATQKNIQVFIIFHESEEAKAFFLIDYFRKAHTLNLSVYDKMQISMHIKPGFSIKFKNKENPLPEITEQLANRTFEEELNYFAIYVSPINKFSTNTHQKEVYYKVKEHLLKRKIASQVIDSARDISLNNKNLVFTLNNIAVAALAKLGGVPWRLETELKEELIIGVGAFKQVSTNTNYIASAFCYQNNGSFQGFEYFRENQTKQLAGSIIKAIKDFRLLHTNLNRLIIHFYKVMSKVELEPIQKALNELQLDIPIFIITVNKTESSDIVFFDRDWAELMPLSGMFVNVGKNTFLLCNNTRYKGEFHSKMDGFPFPIKLKFACSDEEELQNPNTVKELIEQVYQFSRLYYKSVRQQNLPVTIKYPEMVAQIAPHFDNADSIYHVKNKLWFL